MTLPTACTGQLATTMAGTAWTGQPVASSYTFSDQLGNPLTSLTGCDQLPFDPAIEVRPQGEEGQPSSSASTPSGLEVKVKLPQETTLSAGALAEAAVRSATVTLPAGVTLNPAAANGLQACSEQQIGYLGKGGRDPFAPGTLEPLRFSSEPASCPDASKIGTVASEDAAAG